MVTMQSWRQAPFAICMVLVPACLIVNARFAGVTGVHGPAIYTLGGVVSGISQAPLTPLTLSNGTDTVSVANNGAFQFSTKLAEGATFAVSVASSTLCPLYDCRIGGGSGTMTAADRSDIAVVCTPSGLGLPPRLLFSDLTSAPASGGENGKGAYVSLYGLGFGTTPGTVTMSGQAVTIHQWSAGRETTARGLERVTVQLGPELQALDTAQALVLTSADGHASNALDFTVRSAGKIYLVDASAASDGDGSFANPFALLSSARSAVAPGDIVYLQGTFATADPDTSACEVSGTESYALCLSPSTTNAGTPNAPIAYVGYPGASATFSVPPLTAGAAQKGVRVSVDDIVVAGVSFTNTSGNVSNFLDGDAIDTRVVGDTVHDAGMAINSGAQHVHVLGNRLVFTQNAGNAIFAWAFHEQPIHDVEIGFNDLVGTSVRLQGTGSLSVDAIDIHDNLVHGGGVYVFDDNVPGIYGVSIRNNVISDGDFCLRLDSPHCAASDPQACVTRLWNNTCGINQGDSGEIGSMNPLVFLENMTGKWLDFDDDLFFLLPNSNVTNPWVAVVGTPPSPAVLPDDLTFSGNFYAGGGPSPPIWDGQAVSGSPGFLNARDDDYRINALSPAFDAGGTAFAATDFRGVPRPQGKASDIGAFEYCPGLDP